MLACLASQPDPCGLYISTVQGEWSLNAKSLARAAFERVAEVNSDWREDYAEAEALLRSGWSP